METKKTRVELLSWTNNIPETIYCEWLLSRKEGQVPHPAEVHQKILEEREVSGEEMGMFESDVRKVFEDCVAMKVPIAETVGFVFGVHHMPISLREQWVRHRIGHKFNGQFGFDPIPNQHDSSWWSETFRAKDMSKFAAEGEFLEPDWLELYGDKLMEGHGSGVFCECGALCEYLPGKPGLYQCPHKHAPFPINPKLTIRHFWQEQHGWLAAAYKRLCQSGMPPEDARNLLPLGCQHRMTWSTNLSGLMHILSKRGCWIAQLGMWEPVVRGIVEELATKVDPFFRRLVDPPCIGKDGNFQSCRFHKENDEYIFGRDPHHPCPLWLHHHGDSAEFASQKAEEQGLVPTWSFTLKPDAEALILDIDGRFWKPKRPHVTGTLESERVDFTVRGKKYGDLWGRDPVTGIRKEAV